MSLHVSKNNSLEILQHKLWLAFKDQLEIIIKGAITEQNHFLG